jgi:hypothetical protein
MNASNLPRVTEHKQGVARCGAGVFDSVVGEHGWIADFAAIFGIQRAGGSQEAGR